MCLTWKHLRSQTKGLQRNIECYQLLYVQYTSEITATDLLPLRKNCPLALSLIYGLYLKGFNVHMLLKGE